MYLLYTIIWPLLCCLLYRFKWINICIIACLDCCSLFSVSLNVCVYTQETRTMDTGEWTVAVTSTNRVSLQNEWFMWTGWPGMESNSRLELHPSIFYIAYPLRGCWSRSQLSLNERQSTPWTGRQSVTGPTYRERQPLTFTPPGNLDSPGNLICMSLDCGRKSEYLGKTHAGTGRTCKLHTEGPQSASGFKPRNLLLWGNSAYSPYFQQTYGRSFRVFVPDFWSGTSGHWLLTHFSAQQLHNTITFWTTMASRKTGIVKYAS